MVARLDLFIVPVDHVGMTALPVRVLHVVHTSAHLETLHRDAGLEIAENSGADRRDQQRKPDGVREKPWRQQQRAGEKDHRAVRQWL